MQCAKRLRYYFFTLHDHNIKITVKKNIRSLKNKKL